MNLQSAKRAFTLIELLVVIAIIAILAAILFPVFAQAKESAKQTQCISNAKQFGIAFTMYQGDNDDILPPFTRAPGANSTSAGNRYNDIVQPYIKNGLKGANGGQFDGIWRCPSAGPLFNDTINTYAYNVYGLGGFGSSQLLGTAAARGPEWGAFQDASYNTPAAGSTIERVSQTFLIADGGQLMRPHLCVTVLAQGSECMSVFGAHGGLGQGGMVPANTSATFRVERDRLQTGTRTAVVYVDSSAKSVQTRSFYPTTFTGANGWRGSRQVVDLNGWTRTWVDR